MADGLRHTLAELPEQSIVDIAALARGRENVIALWYGEGDLPTPGFVKDAATRALDDGKTFYTPMNGTSELRQAIADYIDRIYGVELPLARITVTPSGMQAIFLAFSLVLDPGDEVVVASPSWPNIHGAVHLAGGRTRHVMMDRGENGWSLDLDRLADAAKGAKAVFLASPNNPNGWIMSADQQIELLNLCRERGLWLVGDEVYGRLVFDHDPAPSLLSIAHDDDKLLIINSFSKAWSMTGWRLGWLTHPPALYALLGQMSLFAHSGTNAFVQHAAIAALEDGEDHIARVRDYCRRGRDVVCDALDGFSRARLPARPEAALYAFFEVDGVTNSLDYCKQLLLDTGVGLAPGSNFGPGLESFMRLSFCTDAQRLAEAMDRLAPALR